MTNLSNHHPKPSISSAKPCANRSLRHNCCGYSAVQLSTFSNSFITQSWWNAKDERRDDAYEVHAAKQGANHSYNHSYKQSHMVPHDARIEFVNSLSIHARYNQIVTSYYVDCKKKKCRLLCRPCITNSPHSCNESTWVKLSSESFLIRASCSKISKTQCGIHRSGFDTKHIWDPRDGPLHVEHVPYSHASWNKRNNFMQGAPWSMMGWCIELAHTSRLQNVFRTYDSWRDECSSPLASNNMPSVRLLLNLDDHGCMICMDFLISHCLTSPAGRSKSKEIPRNGLLNTLLFICSLLIGS